jgi:hypothetical protein
MKSILIALSFIICTGAFAQQTEGSDNVTIGILPVTATDPIARKYCSNVEGIISKVFTGKQRFTIVDRTKLDKIAQERNLQKQEDFLDGLIVEQGKSLGAQYLIQGNINVATATPVQIRKSRVVSVNPYKSEYYYVNGYSVALVVSVQTIDVSTGQVKSTRLFDASNSGVETSSAEQAINMRLQFLDSYRGDRGLGAWANDMFPVTMKVIKIEETDNKGRPKTVLIKGGKDMDLHRGRMGGSELQVYINETMMIDGKEYNRPLPIGKIEVAEPQGDFTVCKVKEGKEEIQKYFNEGKPLMLKMIKW